MFLLILEREKKRERMKERKMLMWKKSINRLPPVCSLTGDRIDDLVMCPDWESNPQPFGAWKDTPTNWATCPVLVAECFLIFLLLGWLVLPWPLFKLSVVLVTGQVSQTACPNIEYISSKLQTGYQVLYFLYMVVNARCRNASLTLDKTSQHVKESSLCGKSLNHLILGIHKTE